KDIPSYQDLFGSLDYCACEDCQSVLSPAAYFVDLMRLINEDSTQGIQQPSDKRLQLFTRRLDLWDIPLDCENTNQVVSYLSLVNKILIQAIQTGEYGGETGKDPYLVLANANYPFNLPSNLPLDNLRCYLKQSKVSLVEIYRLFNVDDSQVSREMLSLSIEKLALITTGDKGKTQDQKEVDLKAYYGVSDLSTLSDVPTFMQQTNITRQQLENLIYQNLSADELDNIIIPNRFFINQDLQGDFIQIMVDDKTGAETLTNLNNDTLDKLHRFIRLADQLSWSYADLDWAWQATVATEEYFRGTDEAKTNLVIHYLSRLDHFHRRYKMPTDELCSFFGNIKTVGQGNNTVSQALFDRMFNQPIVFTDFSDEGNSTPYYNSDSLKAPYHPNYSANNSFLVNPLYGDTPLEWTYSVDTGDNKQYRAHLLSALQISDTDLDFILQQPDILRWALDNVIALDVPSLTQLYRFSQAAKLFNIPVIENILLCNMLDMFLIKGIDDLCNLEEWVDWLQASPLSTYQLHYLVNYPFEPMILLKPDSFVTVRTNSDDDVDADLSENIFDSLLSGKFITATGVVFNKKPLTRTSINKSLASLDLTSNQLGRIVNSLWSCFLLQNTPLKATNVSLKRVDVGYDSDAVLPLINALQASASEVLIKEDSFVSNDTENDTAISSVQSKEIFALLVDAELITSEGVVIHQPDTVIAYAELVVYERVLQSKYPSELQTIKDKHKGDWSAIKSDNEEKLAVIKSSYEADRAFKKSVLNKYLVLQTNTVQEKLANFLDSPVDRVNSLRRILPYSLPSTLEFTGEEDCFVSIKDSHLFKLSPTFTIDLWINVSQYSKVGQVIINQGNQWQLRRCDTDYLAFTLNMSSPLTVVVYHPGTCYWHHLAITYDGTDLTLYIDGLSSPVPSSVNKIKKQPTEEIRLGANQTDPSSFKGQMARVRIWEGATPEAEISQLMYDDTEQADNLQACWLLTAGCGRIVYNAAGVDYPGIISGKTLKWHNYYFNHLLAYSKKDNDKGMLADAQLLVAQLAKHNNVAQWLNVDAEVMQALVDNPSAFGLPGLPYGFTYSPALVRALNGYRAFSCEFKDDTNKLLSYFSLSCPDQPVVEQSQKIQTLSFITGWDEADIYVLENALLKNASKNKYDFNSMGGIVALQQCFQLAKRLNNQPHQLIDLVSLNDMSANNWDFYNQIATDVLQTSTALATTNNKAATDVIRQKSDQENARNLLAGYLLAQLNPIFNDIKTVDDLYAFLLVDVNMSGSTMISPIKLGINSLQLYVQRCQLSLENGATDNIPERQWQWMQSYIIWRANREVYLYPENYIDPSLRKLKTPLYQALQDELLQGDITEKIVNDALGHYVEGLAGIANMQIVDGYYCPFDKKIGGKTVDGETLFLFARSLSESGGFYYRALIVNDSQSRHVYSSWKKIDVAINADTVSGIYAFNTLYVFWVEQQKKRADNGQSSPWDITTATIKYAFQTLDKQWSPPQTLRKDIVIFVSDLLLEYSSHQYNLLGFSYDIDGDYTHTDSWKKVQVMVTEINNQDNIVVQYGDLVHSDQRSEPDEIKHSSGATEAVQFVVTLNEAAKSAYQVGLLHKTSLIPLFLLNQDLAVKQYKMDFSPRNEGSFAIKYETPLANAEGSFAIKYETLLANVDANHLLCYPPSFYGLTGYWTFNATHDNSITSDNRASTSGDSSWSSGKGDPLEYNKVLHTRVAT
ncbi:MAG: hypothetical protein JKY13_01945, partial [Gammaproteobacteria bacterium]|nr:hypothetical protein [Gammaproteobacteria bacterium]